MSYYSEVTSRFSPEYWWRFIPTATQDLEEFGVGKTGSEANLPLLDNIFINDPNENTAFNPIETEPTASCSRWISAVGNADQYRDSVVNFSTIFSAAKYQQCFYNVWIRPTDFTTSDFRVAFSIGNHGGFPQSGSIDLSVFSSDGVTYDVRTEVWRDRRTGSGARLVSPANLLPDVWHMVTLVQDGISMKMYIDGVDVTASCTPQTFGSGVLSDTFNTVAVTSFNTVQPLSIGSRKNDTPSSDQAIWTNGFIGDTSFGSGAPSSADILAVYNSAKTPPEPPATRKLWSGDGASPNIGEAMSLGREEATTLDPYLVGAIGTSIGTLPWWGPSGEVPPPIAAPVGPCGISEIRYITYINYTPEEIAIAGGKSNWLLDKIGIDAFTRPVRACGGNEIWKAYKGDVARSVDNGPYEVVPGSLENEHFDDSDLAFDLINNYLYVDTKSPTISNSGSLFRYAVISE